MKFVSVVNRRLPWLNVAAGMLVMLLQRTPALRGFVQAKDYVIASRAGELLRAAFATATLGAVHSLAGATTYTQNPQNPIQGTVGTTLRGGFSFSGAPSDAQNWTILSGSLPPGVTFNPTPIAGTIRATEVTFEGTPTQAGSFSVTVRANGLAGQSSPVTLNFQISGGAVVIPTFTTQPQSQTVTAGANVTFSVAASGTPTPAFQWTKNGVNIVGATGATLSLSSVQVSDTGLYAVNATNTAGTTPSSAATLTVNPAGGVPAQITSQPLSFIAATGSTAAFTVVASGNGNTYQWRRAGAAVAGGTNATLLLSDVSAANAGDYTVVVNGSDNPVTSSPATLRVESGAGRLANLSVRTNLAASARLIVGFSTNGAKNLLIRGIGPTLGSFGVSGANADPRLELYNASAALTNQNDNWGGTAALAAAFNSVGAFTLDAGSRDAALQGSIAGTYSAHATGAGAGVVLVEVYDAGSGMAQRLVNVSARNQVGTGDDILIAGFVVDGTVAKTLLIRAVGPTLASFGVDGTLLDPKLEIYNSAGVKVVENDNWSAALRGTFSGVGAFDLTTGSRDAALVVSLMPGAYSAQVSGIAGGTGEALVEVYEVP